MPVTTVTGRVPLSFQSPGGTTAALRTFAIVPPGLRDHRWTYPSAIADGSEPPSLPGLIPGPHFRFTSLPVFSLVKILNGVALRGFKPIVPEFD